MPIPTPTHEELTHAQEWTQRHLSEDVAALPFSFLYGGRPSAELLSPWALETETRALDDLREERTLRWHDPASGLTVRAVIVSYRDYPTVEWTVYFRNDGPADTPLLSDLLALDTSFPREETEFVLHHQAGSQATMDDYRPYETRLPEGAVLRLASVGGRGSDGVWPYFALDWGGVGLLLALGWPGQWAAVFARDHARSLHLSAGQERTHFQLHPGEEARSPLIVLQFYQGDRRRAHNLWRRWMLAHNLPRLDGELPEPMLAAYTGMHHREMERANEENQIQFLDAYLDKGIPLDVWWMDAGWYPFRDGWWDTGTWEPDLKRFPRGLRAISDRAHARGVRTMLWFEPERAMTGTWLAEHHPEWFLRLKDEPRQLLDLGNPEARVWLTEHVLATMEEQGIDIYRQDFNMPPLPFWRAHDAPDRQGMSEMQHVMGYLAFWDELRRCRPGLLIDTCASGGRRNDLETLRRSVPLHRSDMNYADPIAKQNQLHGLAPWEPYYGALVFPATHVQEYDFRSGLVPFAAFTLDPTQDFDDELLRLLIEQREAVIANFFGDFYPLTPWSDSPEDWVAWQFDRPEVGEGVVQAFRREQSLQDTMTFRLHNLDPEAAWYRVEDFVLPALKDTPGEAFVRDGLKVTLSTPRSAALIRYQRLDD